MDADEFWLALHDRVGVCGHCGTRSCAGRKSNSVLPKILKTRDVQAAIDAALTLVVVEQPGDGAGRKA